MARRRRLGGEWGRGLRRRDDVDRRDDAGATPVPPVRALEAGFWRRVSGRLVALLIAAQRSDSLSGLRQEYVRRSRDQTPAPNLQPPQRLRQRPDAGRSEFQTVYS